MTTENIQGILEEIRKKRAERRNFNRHSNDPDFTDSDRTRVRVLSGEIRRLNARLRQLHQQQAQSQTPPPSSNGNGPKREKPEGKPQSKREEAPRAPRQVDREETYEEKRRRREEEERNAPIHEATVKLLEPINADDMGKLIGDILQRSFGQLVLVATVLVAVNILVWFWDPLHAYPIHFGRILLLFADIGLVYAGFKWIKEGFFSIGGETPTPMRAIVLRFGKVIGAAEEGLHWRFWPFDKVVKFPKKLYPMNFRVERIFTMPDRDHNITSQQMAATVSMSIRWPECGKHYYMPASGERWYGSDLLARAYHALRYSPETMTEDQLGPDIADFVIDTTRNVIGAGYTHVQLEAKKAEIEDKIKYDLLSEVGNPLREIGLPSELTDVGMPDTERPSDTQSAIQRVEIAYHDGLARRTAAEAAAAAADKEAEAVAARLRPLAEQNVLNPITGLMISGNVTGQAMSLEQIRDIAIAQGVLGGFGGFGGMQGQTRQFGPQDLIHLVNSMSEEELQDFLARIAARLQQQQGR